MSEWSMPSTFDEDIEKLLFLLLLLLLLQLLNLCEQIFGGMKLVECSERRLDDSG